MEREVIVKLGTVSHSDVVGRSLDEHESFVLFGLPPFQQFRLAIAYITMVNKTVIQCTKWQEE